VGQLDVEKLSLVLSLVNASQSRFSIFRPMIDGIILMHRKPILFRFSLFTPFLNGRNWSGIRINGILLY
jgi:hypothetical protein